MYLPESIVNTNQEGLACESKIVRDFMLERLASFYFYFKLPISFRTNRPVQC